MSENPKERIRRRAYEIWEAEGRPHGDHDVHWQRAEAELNETGAAKPSSRKPAAAARTRKPPTRKGKA